MAATKQLSEMTRAESDAFWTRFYAEKAQIEAAIAAKKAAVSK